MNLLDRTNENFIGKYEVSPVPNLNIEAALKTGKDVIVSREQLISRFDKHFFIGKEYEDNGKRYVDVYKMMSSD